MTAVSAVKTIRGSLFHPVSRPHQYSYLLDISILKKNCLRCFPVIPADFKDLGGLNPALVHIAAVHPACFIQMCTAPGVDMLRPRVSKCRNVTITSCGIGVPPIPLITKPMCHGGYAIQQLDLRNAGTPKACLVPVLSTTC